MKTIKLTVEHARELFSKMPEVRTTILHEFTDEELGIKPQPFKWEDLNGINGCYIDVDSRIIKYTSDAASYNRNIYPCGEDAQQALAKCMVLQLAYHYNKCHQHEIKGECYKCLWHKERVVTYEGSGQNIDLVKFLRREDLQKCIADNEDLFKTMLGVRN